MLVIDRVVKEYESLRAVDEVSFSVERGTVFGLLGPNGAGKTTTIRMILDILRPDSGTIVWSGTPVARLVPRRLGYLPEERGLYERMPVAEQLEFFAELRGLTRADARRGARRWLERLDLSPYADTPAGRLSKGNQQKVQLAVAVVHEPELIVLDEPFSGLDPLNHELLEAVIRELRDRGATLLISTHNMEQVEALCDAVAMLNRSRLALAGAVAELRRRHAHAARIIVVFRGDVGALAARYPSLTVHAREGDWLELSVEGLTEPDQLLVHALRAGQVRQLRLAQPSMRQIFIEEVRGPCQPAMSA